ncbi:MULTISPECIES: HAD family hydrolase [Microbacterium]|uniref:HAD family hydrolase n=1 Tax=Microbacterium TaxID=33882 RepID=UPI00217CEB6C|nr:MULTISPECIES: HAD hydrolase family protein [Microbacterium]
MTAPGIGLIATDLDGTLLGSDGQVSPRTRAALDAARDAGIVTVPVTARQPIGLRPIAEQAGFDEWAWPTTSATRRRWAACHWRTCWPHRA